MKNIIVISSFAEDFIEYNNIIKDGGPAFYISNNLDNLLARYTLITGKDKGKVNITKGINGEDNGKIEYISEIHLDEEISNSIVIISTIEREFNLQKLELIRDSLIIIDIQGFLRKIGDNNKKVFYTSFYKSIDYIKCTDIEFNFIDKRIIQYISNKKGGIIITSGGDAIRLIKKGYETNIPLKKGYFKDTIGAGDTFLSSFGFYKSKGLNDEDSIINSNKCTYNFLKKKNLKFKM